MGENAHRISAEKASRALGWRYILTLVEMENMLSAHSCSVTLLQLVRSSDLHYSLLCGTLSEWSKRSRIVNELTNHPGH